MNIFVFKPNDIKITLETVLSIWILKEDAEKIVLKENTLSLHLHLSSSLDFGKLRKKLSHRKKFY